MGVATTRRPLVLSEYYCTEYSLAWHCRYWAVTQVQYIHSRTFRTVGTMILLIWLTSVVVSLAPLFGWKDDGFYDRVNIEKQCLVSTKVRGGK